MCDVLGLGDQADTETNITVNNDINSSMMHRVCVCMLHFEV